MITFVAQSEKEHLAWGEFNDLPENIQKPYDRRLIAARGLVQKMQDNGVLPQTMSDRRFDRVAEWMAAGMKASVDDYNEQDLEFVTVQIPPVGAWGSSTHIYAIDGYEVGSKNTNRLATISRLSLEGRSTPKAKGPAPRSRRSDEARR